MFYPQPRNGCVVVLTAQAVLPLSADAAVFMLLFYFTSEQDHDQSTHQR